MKEVWRENLYKYGFFLTDNSDASIADVDCADWICLCYNRWKLYVHKLQQAFHDQSGTSEIFLIGHAYNPFTMETDERVIIKNLLDKSACENDFFDYLDQLTGSFSLIVHANDRTSVFSDCAGMYGANYSVFEGRIYISSHFQMIADVLRLEEDPYITSMKRSRTWTLYGHYLPHDLTAYTQVKRVLPNVETVIKDGVVSLKRYYPRRQYRESSEAEYPEIVRQAGEILHNSMRLISEKWEKPAVSLTGGMDSKTTLACANGIQDKFSYYSYISLPREETDALAAHEICRQLDLPHEIIHIRTGEDAGLHEQVKALLRRHYGYLGNPHDNDVDKRIALIREFGYSIEVKSWVSEVARASRYGKYRKRKFAKKPTPRMLTSMYKIFLWNRKDARMTDRHFRDYLEKTGLLDRLARWNYPWTEFFVWEIVFGGWGGLALTGEHMVSNNVTVPYNNRALLDLMLKAPLEKRRTDTLHRDIIEYMDKRVNETGISVVNGNETTFRAICERLYFDIHSHIPF